MPTSSSVNRVDEAFRSVASGDRDAFAEWMGLVEIPLRRSLARFARAVDVEVIVQETLLRMWVFAQEPQRTLEGENASLRFACRVARLVAFEETRRQRRAVAVDIEALERLPECVFQPEPPDPALARAIRECLARLPEKPRKAIEARVAEGYRPDRDLAQMLAMKLNTFIQNIVRGRTFLAECLERRGVSLREVPQ